MAEPGAGREGGGGDLLAILTHRKAAVATPGVAAVTAQLGFLSSSERSEPLGPAGQQEGGEEEQGGLHAQSVSARLACARGHQGLKC